MLATIVSAWNMLLLDSEPTMQSKQDVPRCSGLENKIGGRRDASFERRHAVADTLSAKEIPLRW